jgi:hypothetical protein
VLSPDQIKFNQGNLRKRFEEEEKELQLQTTYRTGPGPARRANSHNPGPSGQPGFPNQVTGQRKPSPSGNLLRNLDTELQSLSDPHGLLSGQQPLPPDSFL